MAALLSLSLISLTCLKAKQSYWNRKCLWNTMPSTICLPLKRTFKPTITHRKTSEKGHNSIKYGIYSGHLHLRQKLCARYHDTSSSGYPDVLFTLSLAAKMPKSDEMGHNSNIHRFLRKNNQAICIMCPNSMHDIMILAQAVLQIFCGQDCFTTQNAEVRKGRKSSQIFTEFCQKITRSSTHWTQSVYIIILAQAVL